MIKCKLFQFVAIVLFITTSTAQNINEILVEQLQHASKNKTSDLIYIQTSKDIYETQEDVWFKGYVLSSQTFKPSSNSKILFVQLINDHTNQAVWEEKYEIVNGFVDGHLFLEDSLEPGSYTLAAYSANSFDGISDEFHALRKIQVLKTLTDHTLPQNQKNSVLQFNTYPEGGYLVSGLESTVGFKAVNTKGFPIEISGTLYEDNDPLLDFKSEHAGMGSFVFTPDVSKKYHIELSDPLKQGAYPISEILSSGKVLQLLSHSKDELQFKVSQSTNLKKERIYLRIQMRGTVLMKAFAELTKEVIVKIPLEKLPQGIAEVTLFDKSLQPIAERLVFINQDQKLHITTTLDKDLYQTREKTSLKIKVTDQFKKPVVAHLGVSVYDHIYKNKHGTKTIESHYHLSTQLKGSIYNPNYYFDTNHQNRQRALDLLVSTQGWRRYLWTESYLKSEQDSAGYQLVSDNLIGTVTPKRKRKKVKNVPNSHIVLIFSGNDHKEKDISLTDSTGLFSITQKHLKMAERAYLYVKPMNDPKRTYKLTINDARFEKINQWRTKTMTSYPLFLKPELKSLKTQPFTKSQGVNELSEVYIKGKKSKVYRDKYLGKLDSIARVLDFSFDHNDYVCQNNILNCGNHPTLTKPVVGEEYMVEKAGDYFYIIYRDKNEDLNDKNYTEAELLEKFNLAMLKGFYGKREFYQPVYDSISINDPLLDARNTLLWKPDVLTNAQGEATLEFFCSDVNTKFIGTIEGVSNTGLLGARSFEFVVKKENNE